ncbi:6-phosphogluconolactonase [Acidimicrobiaceae bacterium USS-CC1]|uniref:6-phosphogluconolactonase n=1 Tax=Acidiferrimicrobium australe TaxID=2664430 RepID=A0ABW9QYH1_9ACTN|nr:6-phosphogluconolactonase [Acidiferrimicrobium australe]
MLGVHGELTVVDDLPGAFARTVIEAWQARTGELFHFALCGGSTAGPCYERLAAESENVIDWLSVDVYWGDERCVPGDDPDSNQHLGRQALLERVGGANAVYPMSCDEGPDAYALRLGEVGKLDVIHLGMGPDGHTASLFPGSEALDADPGQLVARNVDPSGRNKLPRMTLTFSAIARARLVVFTVAGAAKRDTLRAVIDGADLPAGRVTADRVVWLVDRDAAPA